MNMREDNNNDNNNNNDDDEEENMDMVPVIVGALRNVTRKLGQWMEYSCNWGSGLEYDCCTENYAIRNGQDPEEGVDF